MLFVTVLYGIHTTSKPARSNDSLILYVKPLHALRSVKGLVGDI